jgi:hypothetical protein
MALRHAGGQDWTDTAIELVRCVNVVRSRGESGSWLLRIRVGEPSFFVPFVSSYRTLLLLGYLYLGGTGMVVLRLRTPSPP